MTRELHRRRYGPKRAADAARAAALVRKADARYREGGYEETLKLYGAAAEAGASGRAPAMFVALTAQLKESEEALEMADRLISREPESGAAYAARATSLMYLNRHAEAVDAFAVAARKDPGHAEIYCDMGCSLSSLGRHAEAVGAYRQSVEMLPRDRESIYCLCRELENLDRHAEALSLLKKKRRETGAAA